MILDRVNMSFKRGEFVAIVGSSGIGKSTVINLIYRLYDPISGHIELDSQELRSLDFDFRKEISVVAQTPYIFNGTVLENLTYGSANPNKEEVEDLTEKLGLLELIESLPQKFDTPVGEKGSIFSGG